MTEPARTSGPRPKRPHAAARARIIAAGLAGTTALSMVAAMALPHGGNVAATPAGPATVTGQSAPTDSRSVTPVPAPVPAQSLAPAPVTSSSGS